MAELMNRYELRNRYVFTGKLVMLTAFHIGGGHGALSSSDSPVVLTPEGTPFIPGSSFKGALRSTVEKIVPGLPAEAKMFSCGLIELSNDDMKQEEEQGHIICSTVRQAEIVQERRRRPAAAEQITKDALDGLCHTCQLFGSPFAASRVNINDMYMSLADWGGAVQVRDGVAIDRDSERAKDRLKYDFEVVPASAEFGLTITLENASPQDLQLLCVGLSEFMHGFGFIGGKRSRGLGACEIRGLQVSALELVGKDIETAERYRRLRDYLLGREVAPPVAGEKFLEQHINAIFESAAL